MSFHPCIRIFVTIFISFHLLLISHSVSATEPTKSEFTHTTTHMAAQKDDRQMDPSVVQEKSLLNLLGIPGTINVARAAVYGDGQPHPDEKCDDDNLVAGDGCDSTCLNEAGRDCTASLAEGLTENIIIDGSFEDNDPAWILVGSAFDPRCSIATCLQDHTADGEFYIWIGGGKFVNGNDATATQSLVIPATATTLTFEWSSNSNALPQGTCENPDNDLLELLIDGIQQFRTSNPCVESLVFQTVTIDLVALGLNDDQLHEIQFHGINVDVPPAPFQLLTNFFLDNVRLDVPLANEDTDLDGVFDDVDNCTLEANADQRDTNGDGYGNVCDPDLDDNGVVNFGDISSWVPFFNSTCGDVDEDFNGDGFCNFGDYALFPQFFQQPPGPGAIDNLELGL